MIKTSYNSGGHPGLGFANVTRLWGLIFLNTLYKLIREKYIYMSRLFLQKQSQSFFSSKCT